MGWGEGLKQPQSALFKMQASLRGLLTNVFWKQVLGCVKPLLNDTLQLSKNGFVLAKNLEELRERDEDRLAGS